MSLVEELHRERKARLARIASRAFVPPAPMPVVIEETPEPEPEPRKPVRRRYGFHKLDRAYERAWSIVMLNIEPAVYEPRKLRIEEIQQAVCDHFGLSMVELVSQRRTQCLVFPRSVAIYLSRRLTPKSYPEIGKRFGGRDHTTALHANRQITKRLETDEQLQASVEMLIEILGGES